MIYYIDDETNTVYAYEEGQPIREGLRGPVSEAEALAMANPPPTSAQVLALESAKLQEANQLAAAQKTALTNRIGVIKDAIDFDEATPAELVELPLRETQLTAWKRYTVLLGRVTAQSGWHMAIVWPVQPEQGMDLTVSAVSRPVQAS